MQDLDRFVQARKDTQRVLRVAKSLLPEFGDYTGYKGMLERMEHCGTFLKSSQCPTGLQGHTGKLVAANFCRSRFCPTCQWRKGLRVSQEIYRKIAHVQAQSERERMELQAFFVTLTVPNVSRPEDVNLQKLTSSFAKLRRKKFWTERVLGGVWSVEITSGKNGYHPHLHCIVLASPHISKDFYLWDNDVLSYNWLQVTGDAYITRVLACYDKYTGTKAEGDSLLSSIVELAKYPMVSIDGNPRDMLLLYPYITGRRMSGSFGILRGVDMEPDDLIGNDDHGKTCEVCGAGLVQVTYLWRSRFGRYLQLNNQQELEKELSRA